MRRASLRFASAASVELEKRLGAAVLAADSASFDAIVADLRGVCHAAARRRAPGEGVVALVSELGKAALEGRHDAFAHAEAELRSLCRSRADRTAPEPDPAELPSEAVTSPDMEPEVAASFPWSALPFSGGAAANAAALRALEDEYAKLVDACGGDLNNRRLLSATLDLAGVYIKTHCLDKAELLLQRAEPTCRKVAGEWGARCIQDLAALRLEQGRQHESAALLEELVAENSSSASLQRQLGIVYLATGDTQRATDRLEEAVQLQGGEANAEDLWHQAMVRKKEGDGPAAIAILLAVLQKLASSSDALRLAKVQQSLAECYLNEGMVAEAIERYQLASGSFEQLVGKQSPLYGAAEQGLAEALASDGRRFEAFEALQNALEVQAKMDGIQPTMFYELLDLAEELILGPREDESERSEVSNKPPDDPRFSFASLIPTVDRALTNLSRRRLDQDANGGVVLQKAAQALIYAAETLPGERSVLRARAVGLLRRARDLMRQGTDADDIDLSELCAAADLQLELLEAKTSSA